MEETYAAFAHAHRLNAPFVVNRTFELQEPRMRQISQPPISRMFYCDLIIQQASKYPNGWMAQRAKNTLPTLIEFAEQSASNDVRRCCTSELQTASSDWSGTIRSDTCAVTDAGITVGSFCIHILIQQQKNKKPGAEARRGDVLVGPDPRTLCIVSEGSRQRAESDAAD